MSFAIQDLTGPKLAMLASCNRVYHRYVKLFAKKIDPVYGVEVFNKRAYFYVAHEWQEYPTDRQDPFRRFLNALGASYEKFKEQEIDEEMETLWMKLNPNEYEWDGSFAGDSRINSRMSTQASTQLVAPTASEIVDMFNDEFRVGDKFEVTTVYGGKQKRYVSSHKLEWELDDDVGIVRTVPFDKEAIRNTLDSNPWYYIANTNLNPYTKDSNQFQLYDGGIPYSTNKNQQLVPTHRLEGTVQTTATKMMGLFASLDTSGSFEKIKIHKEEMGTSNTLREDGEVLKYTYVTVYEFKGVDEQSQIVQDIVRYYEAKATQTIKNRPAYTPVGVYRDRIKYMVIDNNIKRALDKMQVYLDPYTGAGVQGTTNSLFYNGYLRYEEGRLMRRTDFTQMIIESLDTDGAAMEAEWWEKAYTFISFIVAALIIWFTWGTGTPMAIAIALGNGAMVLGVAGMLLSLFGGLSAQHLVSVIGKVAQLLGIASMIVGFYAAIQEAGKELARQTLIEAGTSVTAENIAQEMLTQTLTDQVSALVSQSIDSAMSKVTEFVAQDMAIQYNTVTDGLQFVVEGMKFYQDQELEELQDDLDKLNEEQKEIDSELLNNSLKNPAAVWGIMEDRVTSYDAITNTDITVAKMVTGDDSYLKWYTNVNSK